MARQTQTLVRVDLGDDVQPGLTQFEAGRCALDIGGVVFHGTLEQMQRIASRIGELTVKASCQQAPAGRAAWTIGGQS